MNVHVAGAPAAFFSRDQIYFSDVRNEVGMENATVVLGKVFSFFGKKFRVAGIEAVFEYIIRIIDKVWVAVELKGNRLAREREIAAGLRATGIEVLVPGVQWNGEGAAAFPLEGAFGRTLIPDGSGATTGSDGDDLFIELALGFCLLAGIDFTDIGIRHHLIRESANRPFTVFAFPITQGFGSHVTHESAADDGNTFGLDPSFVWTVFVHHELHVRMNFKFL